jgi:hypothetical protein
MYVAVVGARRAAKSVDPSVDPSVDVNINMFWAQFNCVCVENCPLCQSTY